MGAVATLAPTTLPVEPGLEASLEVTIRNNGSVVDQFTLEILGDAAPWATADPPTLSLFPAAQGTVRITFRPPRTSATKAGPLRVGVMVRSKEDPAGSTVEEASLDVAPFQAPSAELIPRTSHGSRRAHVDLAVDNRGNAPLAADLEGLDPDRLVRFAFDPPKLSVDPGVAGFAKVVVKPVRTFWRGAAKTRPFQLAVRPAGAGDSPVLLDGSFLQESILPWWFLRALTAAIALLIAAILLWVLVLQPTIKSSAAQTLVDFGFSPKPGSAAAGGSPKPGESGAPVPSGALTATPEPGGGQTQVDGRLDTSANAISPPSGILYITDLVFSNSTGASGDLTLQRESPSGITQLLVLRLENFRDLDFHFVTPIAVHAGETLKLVATCAAPAGPAPAACIPAVFYSGYIQGE